jgi:hypothetical protein
MAPLIFIELLGYAAMVLVAVSLMMTSILRLRFFNMLGAVLFSIYGLLIQAYPVAVLNGLLALLNLWFIVRMLRAKAFFRILPLHSDSDYLRYFLDFYGEKIRKILPEFAYVPSENQLTLFVLRDCRPVGVFIAEKRPDGVLRVVLDYVIPNYRDLALGRFLFIEQAGFFRGQGVREIVVAPRTKDYAPFLIRVGFKASTRREGELYIHFAAEGD